MGGFGSRRTSKVTGPSLTTQAGNRNRLRFTVLFIGVFAVSGGDHRHRSSLQCTGFSQGVQILRQEENHQCMRIRSRSIRACSPVGGDSC